MYVYMNYTHNSLLVVVSRRRKTNAQQRESGDSIWYIRYMITPSMRVRNTNTQHFGVSIVHAHAHIESYTFLVLLSYIVRDVHSTTVRGVPPVSYSKVDF